MSDGHECNAWTRYDGVPTCNSCGEIYTRPSPTGEPVAEEGLLGTISTTLFAAIPSECFNAEGWPGTDALAAKVLENLHGTGYSEKAELERQVEQLSQAMVDNIAEAPTLEVAPEGYLLVTLDEIAALKAERQPVKLEDLEMDFEPSGGAMEIALDWFDKGQSAVNAARLIDHLEGTAPVKVDKTAQDLRVLLSIYDDHGFEPTLAKFKEYKNG